jgi:hypothetical protein
VKKTAFVRIFRGGRSIEGGGGGETPLTPPPLVFCVFFCFLVGAPTELVYTDVIAAAELPLDGAGTALPFANSLHIMPEKQLNAF